MIYFGVFSGPCIYLSDGQNIDLGCRITVLRRVEIRDGQSKTCPSYPRHLEYLLHSMILHITRELSNARPIHPLCAPAHSSTRTSGNKERPIEQGPKHLVLRNRRKQIICHWHRIRLWRHIGIERGRRERGS